MRTLHRTLPAVLLAALALAGVAACGSDDEQSAADRAATLASEQQRNPPTVTEVDTTVKAEKVSATAEEQDLDAKPKIDTEKLGEEPDELVAQDLVVGEGTTAKEGDTVKVQYVGVLFDGGKEFDSSWKRDKEPFEFPLGQGQVIQGWDQGVAGMKEGGRRRLIIPSSLAYGPQGQPPTIPPDAALVFVVDLESVDKAKGE